MHCKSLWIKASAKCINVNVVEVLHALNTKLQTVYIQTVALYILFYSEPDSLSHVVLLP